MYFFRCGTRFEIKIIMWPYASLHIPDALFIACKILQLCGKSLPSLWFSCLQGTRSQMSSYTINGQLLLALVLKEQWRNLKRRMRVCWLRLGESSCEKRPRKLFHERFQQVQLGEADKGGVGTGLCQAQEDHKVWSSYLQQNVCRRYGQMGNSWSLPCLWGGIKIAVRLP